MPKEQRTNFEHYALAILTSTDFQQVIRLAAQQTKSAEHFFDPLYFTLNEFRTRSGRSPIKDTIRQPETRDVTLDFIHAAQHLVFGADENPVYALAVCSKKKPDNPLGSDRFLGFVYFKREKLSDLTRRVINEDASILSVNGYIDPQFRRQGIGSGAILRALHTLVHSDGFARLVYGNISEDARRDIPIMSTFISPSNNSMLLSMKAGLYVTDMFQNGTVDFFGNEQALVVTKGVYNEIKSDLKDARKRGVYSLKTPVLIR